MTSDAYHLKTKPANKSRLIKHDETKAEEEAE
jgi:hypothetical protein